MHEGNLLTKINNNYGGHGEEIQAFYNDKYLPMRSQALELVFDEEHLESFVTATEIFNEYYSQLKECRERLDIDEHSKFSSTFLEEISSYKGHSGNPAWRSSWAVCASRRLRSPCR